ncbi:MAG: glycosyltransferase family 2 protein [Syntrophothermus sp.]
MRETLTRNRILAGEESGRPARAALLGEDLALIVDGAAEAGGRRGGGVEARIAPADALDGIATTELGTLLREELARLPRPSRERILAQISAAPELERAASTRVGAALHTVREVLRERLPRCEVSETRVAGVAVERILAIDDNSFWINGWRHDHDGRGDVAVVSPEGQRTPLTDAYRYERPDVVQFYSGVGVDRTGNHGFTAHFRLPAPSLLATGWLAELSTSDGLQLEASCPPVVGDVGAVREAILGELGARGAIGGPLATDHGAPALTALQRRIVSESKLESVLSFGEPCRQPAVSVVVPLYRRLDFLEHQLLHFSQDPELASADLIYVLDSPEQQDELERLAADLFALHHVPFRIVNLSASGGYAAANNHGISVARASRLLLLNSDVIPERPGWLGKMTGFFEAVDRIGALGPKLLYEDDSVQHAGLFFHRPDPRRSWQNAHCFKGMHRSFRPANVSRPVPAVTGACMMIDRDLYEEVGGLPAHYVQGDCEDSELCLRLAAAGRVNWYTAIAELYHLEGQSYASDIRRLRSEYNHWLQSALLGDRIEQAMAEFDPNATVAPSDR